MIHMVQNRNNREWLGQEIILALLKGDSHLREIARAIKEPHSTVLRRLNQMARENIIDFRKEGRNKMFFLKKNISARNYIFTAERHKMLKLLKAYPKLSIILEDILKSSKERMVIIFGSYASFSAKEDSDIDVYIETIDRNAKYKMQELSSKLSVKTGNFDLSSLLIKEIIKNHVILKGVEDFYEKTKFFS